MRKSHDRAKQKFNLSDYAYRSRNFRGTYFGNLANCFDDQKQRSAHRKNSDASFLSVLSAKTRNSDQSYERENNRSDGLKIAFSAGEIQSHHLFKNFDQKSQRSNDAEHPNRSSSFDFTRGNRYCRKKPHTNSHDLQRIFHAIQVHSLQLFKGLHHQ